MLVMTSQPPEAPETSHKVWIRKLDRATQAHEKTRKALDDLVADARSAGLPLTLISEHTPYSREWVRRIAAAVQDERAQEAEGGGAARRT